MSLVATPTRSAGVASLTQTAGPKSGGRPWLRQDSNPQQPHQGLNAEHSTIEESRELRASRSLLLLSRRPGGLEPSNNGGQDGPQPMTERT